MTVRVRFAPSPTGYLHIGGVRTALFNWLWARKTGGTFILRIEDTDQERSTPENERIILESLRWLGIDWDEGPEVGGKFGPYRQMERLSIYREMAETLIAKGFAYRCSCTKADLDRERDALRAKDPKAQFRYPGTCRNRGIGPNDGPAVIRMKAPSSGSVTYHDKVFGEVTTPNSAQQDAILVRTDGVPLYNFGAVVDDVTMGVTLVARGRDHMINTPPQILLYEALGAKVPEFAHLPMMLNQKGEKLSKRDGAVSVTEYRDAGVPPGGLLNYLVRFGWSFGDEEIFSKKDLVEKFDWDRCGKGDGKFDQKKLDAVVFEHMKSATLIDNPSYLRDAKNFTEQRGLVVDETILAQALPLVRERAQTFKGAAELVDYLFRDPPILDEKARAKFLVPEKATILLKVAEFLEQASPFEAKPLETGFTALLASLGLELKDAAQPVRVALTGRTASPGLFEVAVLLGRERCVARLRAAASLAAG